MANKLLLFNNTTGEVLNCDFLNFPAGTQFQVNGTSVVLNSPQPELDYATENLTSVTDTLNLLIQRCRDFGVILEDASSSSSSSESSSSSSSESSSSSSSFAECVGTWGDGGHTLKLTSWTLTGTNTKNTDNCTLYADVYAGGGPGTCYVDLCMVNDYMTGYVAGGIGTSTGTINLVEGNDSGI